MTGSDTKMARFMRAIFVLEEDCWGVLGQSKSRVVA